MDSTENLSKPSENFITVVSVGEKNEEGTNGKEKEFVTVLRIGEEDPDFVTEEVLVYRLPGERLGFGLKFEGGTKASEYVKKLFIQSCAPDSPASKVVGSWGHLTEGDEVLVIDSRPVTSMTRMDCVKCLKDSSVVIKLLVRHQRRTEEDLPLVVNAEKKKPPALPPTPPPVPPRKIPKRGLRNKMAETNSAEAKPTPQSRLKSLDNKHSSPETRNNRKLAEGRSAPPEAEYYVDLFSQDSIHSLSESDDTASTISTVVDRNGNSLPSTPKSIQKHLDISNFPDEDNIFNMKSETKDEFELTLSNDMDEANVDFVDASNDPKYAEPSASFEDMQRDLVFQAHDENMNIFSLPRLVDFVPKNFSHMDHKRIMDLFLCCERGEHFDFRLKVPGDGQKVGCFNDGVDVFTKWRLSPQLATIGEDEEDENISNSFMSPTLVVDGEEGVDRRKEPEMKNQTMEPPPSDRRQPPDGHEFPDFEESFLKRSNERFRPRSTQEQERNTKTVQENSFSSDPPAASPLSKMTSISNVDLRASERDENKNCPRVEEGRCDNSLTFPLYSRSQSLCDVSTRKNIEDPIQHLVEQRRKNLSKLKGLVIPDAISECDSSTTINLPEIKSDTSLLEKFKPIESPEVFQKTSEASSVNSTVLPPITPAWAATVNFPKYSPAFKRKDLKIHSSTSLLERSPTEMRRETFNFNFSGRHRSFDGSTSKSENSSDCFLRDKPKTLSQSSSSLYKKEINTDEESENDSAVSSSQSSFASRPTESSSTSAVPSDQNSDFKSAKLSSVEALNRKNILASAKCRSGKDFKIGSPVVNRKLETNEDKTENVKEIMRVERKNEVQVIEEKRVAQPETLVAKLTTIAPEKIPSVASKRTVESPMASLRKIETKIPSRTSLPPASNKDKHAFLNVLKPVPVLARKEERVSKFTNRKSLSVTDLRKNFEEIARSVAATPTFNSKKEAPKAAKLSVPLATEEPSRQNRKTSIGNFVPSETTKANGKSRKVILKPNMPGENIGITISGGTEESKDIIVHRIRYGSVAYQDGTLIKGDQILSINGVPTKGLDYCDAVQLLKVPSEAYVIEIALKDETAKDMRPMKRRSVSLDSTLDSENIAINKISATKKPNHEIVLFKDPNGLGFSVEGGRDSPLGDVPITVKKIFQGGVADKDGRLKVGDEIISINDVDFTNLSRIQAWTFMKKADLGKTKIMIFR